MNKTNYIILALVLCFSLAFVTYPIKTNALSDWAQEQIDNYREEYEEPGYYEEPSGEYITPEYANHIVELPPTTSPPATKPPSTKPPSTKPPATSPPATSPPATSPPATSPPPTSPPPPPPPPQQRRCVLIYSRVPCADTCGPSSGNGPGTPSPPPPPPPPKYSCNESTWTCYQNSSGIYSSLSRCQDACVEPPCMIDYFEFPKRAWVGYSITGKWSASTWCKDCDVTCSPYPECVWKENNIGIGFDEYKFTIKQSGTYTYTLTCYKQGGADQRQATVILEALNLPWWREIIPVLPGSLFSSWPWK